MTTSLVDAESILALDIGSVHTRAFLFDVVDGQYRFISAGIASSTAGAPFFDISEGVYQAVQKLQNSTGRSLFDQEGHLILPGRPDGTGVDQLVITFTAGPALRVVTAGLLEDVSLESANHLAATVTSTVLENIGLNDRRKPELQIDAILAARPEVVILAGGTERGATRSVLKLVEMILLALQVIPPAERPEVIYAGNQTLVKYVKEGLERICPVHPAPNLRPGIDSEDLIPAQNVLAEVTYAVRGKQLNGLKQLGTLASTPPLPGSHGFGRMVRFLSTVYDPARGVLGVDLGGSYTTLAAAQAGQLSLMVHPMGIGAGITRLLDLVSIEEILQWVPYRLSAQAVKEMLWQKSLYPSSVPMTGEALAVEQAVARLLLRQAMAKLPANQPASYEPILASGHMLTQNSSPGQSLLTILDGIQPVGITTVVLDSQGMLPALGAIAGNNAVLPVQVFESNALLHLGTVITPLCDARYGTAIMNVRVETEDGVETKVEVRQGSLVSLPLSPGQSATVHLQPLRHMIIDPAIKNVPRGFKVIGGACGAVIDARGRPLVLPNEESRRRDMLKKWALTLGSQTVV